MLGQLIADVTLQARYELRRALSLPVHLERAESWIGPCSEPEPVLPGPPPRVPRQPLAPLRTSDFGSNKRCPPPCRAAPVPRRTPSAGFAGGGRAGKFGKGWAAGMRPRDGGAGLLGCKPHDRAGVAPCPVKHRHREPTIPFPDGGVIWGGPQTPAGTPWPQRRAERPPRPGAGARRGSLLALGVAIPGEPFPR